MENVGLLGTGSGTLKGTAGWKGTFGLGTPLCGIGTGLGGINTPLCGISTALGGGGGGGGVGIAIGGASIGGGANIRGAAINGWTGWMGTSQPFPMKIEFAGTLFDGILFVVGILLTGS